MNARLLAAILLLLPSLAVADLRVPSALEEVTVYPGSALVTRRGRTTVPKGEVRIHLEGLTPRLLDDSVRVETSGSARARILGIRVEAEPRSESTSAPLREAESALRALEDRDRELQDEAARRLVREIDLLEARYGTSTPES